MDGTLPPVRSDALPGATTYRDNGCDVAPNCLKCPLPECRYAAPDGIRGIKLLQRNPEIARLRREGMAEDDIAARFKITRRTVIRILVKARARDV